MNFRKSSTLIKNLLFCTVAILCYFILFNTVTKGRGKGEMLLNQIDRSLTNVLGADSLAATPLELKIHSSGTPSNPPAPKPPPPKK